MAIAEPSNTLEEVVVTAQRKTQNLLDVPLTLTAVSQSQLENAGVTNIFDLTAVVSGLTFGGVGNLTQPAIRGLSTGVSTNGSENPNALYIDDVYYSQGNLLGANLPDVERVEVLKGPQGTLFGRNSVGGAIRIFTQDPELQQVSGKATVEAGFYTGADNSQAAPRHVFNGVISLPLGDTVAASVSASHDKTDGFMTDQTTGDDYGAIARLNLRAKLLWQPNKDFSALLSAFHLKHNDEGLQSATPYKGLTVAALYDDSIIPSDPFHTGYDYGNGVNYNAALVETDSVSLKFNVELQGVGALSAITAYHETEVFNTTTFTHSQALTCAASFVCIDYYYLATNEAFSQEFNFTSESFGSFSYTAGLFYYQQDSTTDAAVQETVVPGGVPAKSVEFNIESVALYGEMQYQPADDYLVIVGARYTHEPHKDKITYPTNIAVEETFTSFIPRLTLQRYFGDNSNGYITYSEGEKSGLSGVDNPGAIAGELEKIDPEENSALEIGYKYAAPSAVFNVSAFYYDYKNKQEQGFTGETVFVQNTGPVDIIGIDADTRVQLNEHWTFRSALTWLPIAEYKDFPDAAAYSTNLIGTRYEQVEFDATGYRLVKAPKLTANVGFGYERQLPRGQLNADVNVSYSSKVYHDIYHVIEQPSFYTVNAKIGFSLIEAGLDFSLYGRNLTNEEYIAHGFPSGLGFTAAYARPQELGVRVNFQF
ncbi:TonB-dependent receptor [Halioxenophilus aromaticivorans]|uniref:TonB-dependent receptor n=1 Tax=Halioxenophilus aromaticivorans TaxID=1306992 RepID=A0AAV3TWJ3_9ALTE